MVLLDEVAPYVVTYGIGEGGGGEEGRGVL